MRLFSKYRIKCWMYDLDLVCYKHKMAFPSFPLFFLQFYASFLKSKLIFIASSCKNEMYKWRVWNYSREFVLVWILYKNPRNFGTENDVWRKSWIELNNFVPVVSPQFCLNLKQLKTLYLRFF